MDNGKRRFKAVINGETYVIIGTKSDEHLKAVTALVNEQLEQLTALSPTLTDTDRAILLSLNVMSQQVLQEIELTKLKQKIKKLELQLEDAKNPDKVLARMQKDVAIQTSGEQLVLDGITDTLTIQPTVKTDLFKSNKDIPAIQKK